MTPTNSTVFRNVPKHVSRRGLLAKIYEAEMA